MIQKFLSDEEGQDLIEYALLAALIALAAVVGMTSVALAINNAFTAIGSKLNLLTGAAPASIDQ